MLAQLRTTTSLCRQRVSPSRNRQKGVALMCTVLFFRQKTSTVQTFSFVTDWCRLLIRLVQGRPPRSLSAHEQLRRRATQPSAFAFRASIYCRNRYPLQSCNFSLFFFFFWCEKELKRAGRLEGLVDFLFSSFFLLHFFYLPISSQLCFFFSIDSPFHFLFLPLPDSLFSFLYLLNCPTKKTWILHLFLILLFFMLSLCTALGAVCRCSWCCVSCSRCLCLCRRRCSVCSWCCSRMLLVLSADVLGAVLRILYQAVVWGELHLVGWMDGWMESYHG